VGLYFSGYWCPPSLQFTPILQGFYNKLAHGNDFEIVFVSWDRSDSEMKNYLSVAHGNWLYLPLGSPKIEELNALYKVNAIPTLIIIHPNGGIIARDGRELVERNQPKQTLEMWKARLY
jgi:thiol-disulfide isomerase/thioredoxin